MAARVLRCAYQRSEESDKYSDQHLSDSTFSRESHDFTIRWLDKCLREHNACRSEARSRALPGRLVQIGPPGSSLNPRLVETDQLPLSTKYIALSPTGTRRYSTT
jgi:hypothetical protein